MEEELDEKGIKYTKTPKNLWNMKYSIRKSIIM